MSSDKTLPLSLDFEGKHYEGEVTPSEEKGSNEMPVYFRITVNGELFAYLCCGDNGWREREDSGLPRGLIGAIGNYILDFYK